MKKTILQSFIFSFLLTFTSHSINGQQAIEWYRHFEPKQSGGFQHNRASSFIVLPDESVLLIGNTEPDSGLAISRSDTLSLNYPTFITRFSNNGATIFTRPFNKNTSELNHPQLSYLSSIDLDSKGNIYLVSTLLGNWIIDSLNPTPVALSNNHYVFKLNANGDILSYTALPAPQGINTWFSKFFIANDDHLYVSHGNNTMQYLTILDTSLNIISTSLLASGTGYYTILDKNTSGQYLATGNAVSNAVDINPGSGVTMLQPTKNHLCLLDSGLNLIRYLKTTANFQYSSAGFDYADRIILMGDAAGYGFDSIQIADLPVATYIPDNLKFICQLDTSMRLNWIKYFQQSSNCGDGQIRCNNYGNFKRNIRPDNSILFRLFGCAQPGNNNFHIPEIQELPPANSIYIPAYFIVLDSIGDPVNLLRFPTYSYEFYSMANDSTLFMNGWWNISNPAINISPGTIPDYIKIVANDGVFVKFGIHRYPRKITGSLTADQNSNYVHDPAEGWIPYLPVYLHNTQYWTLSNAQGKYTIDCPDGNYTLMTANKANFNSSYPASIPVQVNNQVQISDSNDFYFTPENYVHDLEISGVTEPAIPGQSMKVQLLFNNIGTIISNAAISMIFDTTKVQFASSLTSPYTVSHDTFAIQLQNNYPFVPQIINTIFIVNPTLSAGDTIRFRLHINPFPSGITDIDTTNNYAEAYSVVTNDTTLQRITSSNGSIISSSLPDSNLMLDYLIQFRNNTGDTIQQLILLDSLPSQMRFETFTWEGSSHPATIQVENNNVLAIKLENTGLIPYSLNPNYSTLFARFKISPKLNVMPGDSIKNKVIPISDGIVNPVCEYTHYFTTNTYSEVPDIIQGINIYPNPGNGLFRITERNNSAFREFIILDLTGRELLKILQNCTSPCTIDLISLSSGIYFLKATMKDGRSETNRITINK